MTDAANSSFRVVLSGRILPGFDPPTVQRKLIALTGQAEDVAAQLLAGKPTVVKRQLSATTAAEFVAALKAIGVDAHSEPDAPWLAIEPELTQEPIVANQRPASAKPPPTEATPNVAFPDSIEAAYRAVIGPVNTDYYLRAFGERDRQSAKTVWNWSAFFGWGLWALYRKCWAAAALMIVIVVLTVAVVRTSLPALSEAFAGGVLGATALSLLISLALPACIFGYLANPLYHRKASALISRARARSELKDEASLLQYLQSKGGVNLGVPAVFLLLGTFGLYGTLTEEYGNYLRRTPAEEAQAIGTTQPQNASRSAASPPTDLLDYLLEQGKAEENQAPVDASFNRRDFVRDLRKYLPLAEAGDPAAQREVGVVLVIADPPLKDVESGLRWLRSAADQGDIETMMLLSRFYHGGRYLPKDDVEGTRWIRKAAELGDAESQIGLGLAYSEGKGVKMDAHESARWYLKAADSGSTDAMILMGDVYEKGRGVVRDYERALTWYRKAANLGDREAQYHLGDSYERGSTVRQDLVEAHKWFNIAASTGNSESAGRRLGWIEEKMTPTQIAEAQKRAREWKQK